MVNVVVGKGERSVAADLYHSAILQEVDAMRRDGVYVCQANLQRRMLSYNQDMLVNTFWTMCRNGEIA